MGGECTCSRRRCSSSFAWRAYSGFLPNNADALPALLRPCLLGPPTSDKSPSPPLFRPLKPPLVGLPIRLCANEGTLVAVDLIAILLGPYVGREEGGDIGELVLLLPNEARLLNAPDPDRFRSCEDEYMPELGIGRKVGVVGRDIGVGIELEVLVVALVLMLLLPSVEVDKRDCGLLLFKGAAVCDNALGARLGILEGDGEGCIVSGRKAEGALGLEVRRLSLSLSFTGDGVSSMISTQPDVSPAGVLRFSFSRSTFGFLIFIVGSLSS